MSDSVVDELQQLVEQGAVEAVSALKRVVATTDPKSRRDVVNAAKELLVAAQVGGHGKGSNGSTVNMLFGAEQVSGLLGTMQKVAESITIEGTAEEVADVPAPPKPKRKRAPAKKAATKKRTSRAKPRKKPDLLSKEGATGLSADALAEANGTDHEAGLDSA